MNLKNKVKFMNKILNKIIFFQLIIILATFSFSQVVFAGFVDSDTYNNNEVKASSLNMQIDDQSSFSRTDLKVGENVDFIKVVKNVGEEDFKYKVLFEIVNDQNNICSNLELNVNNGSSDIFSGKLEDFDYKSSLIKNGSENLTFSVKLPDDADSSLENLECKFDVKFIAWQNTLNEPNSGWIDKEEIKDNFIFTADLAPNKPTGIRILNSKGEDLGCEGFVNERKITIDWNDSIEADFDHYDYRIREENIIAKPTKSYYTGSIRDIDDYYKYSVRAVDKNGNFGDWSDWCGVTLDRSIPIISNINVIKKNSTPNNENLINTINWDTNEEATTNIIWDIVPHSDYNYAYKFPTTEDLIADNISHSLDFNLAIENEKSYYFRVVSMDKAGNISYSDEQTFQLNSNPVAVISKGDVVLNEFMPNPDASLYNASSDNDLIGEEGEWIELYNNLDDEIDLKDYYFEDDASIPNRVIISNLNTNTGDTKISSKGYLVIYDIVPGPTGFGLSNSGDTIKFYNPSSTLVDSFAYTETIDGKTYARFPDGGVWVDPQPTPGKENKLTDDEFKYYQNIVLDDCFKENKLIKNNKQKLCNSVFVEYVDLIEDEKSDKLKDEYIKGEILNENIENKSVENLNKDHFGLEDKKSDNINAQKNENESIINKEKENELKSELKAEENIEENKVTENKDNKKINNNIEQNEDNITKEHEIKNNDLDSVREDLQEQVNDKLQEDLIWDLNVM